MKPQIKRMFINQASTLQPLHKYHGMKVLAVDTKEKTIRVFPISGDVISMHVPRAALSKGGW